MRRNLLLTVLLVTGSVLTTAQTVTTHVPKSASRQAAVEAFSAEQKSVRPSKEQLLRQEGLKRLQNPLNSVEQDVKVLQSKKTKDGIIFQTIQKADGQIIKRVVGKEIALEKVGNNKHHTKAQSRATTNVSFEESFEGWDGTTKDWIPAEWTDISKVNSLTDDGSKNHFNRTWKTMGDGTYSSASDGQYFAHIQFAVANMADTTANRIPVTQDEWLTSPAFTVKDANQNLYADINYSPAWYILNPETYEFNGRYSNIEILVSKDGGTKWVSLWNAIDDDALVNYTEDELWNDAVSMSHPWITVKISLKEYAGQNIKLAFRYTNKGEAGGESAAIDAIRVGVSQPQALYRRPFGNFFGGMSQDFISMPDRYFILGPGYHKDTWINVSNSDSESFEWTFINPETYKDYITLTDIHPTIKYDYARVDAPILKAKATGAEDNIYQWNAGQSYIQTGGNGIINFSDVGPKLMGVGNYDISLKLTTAIYDRGENKYCFGTGAEGLWGEELTSIANYFEKPNHKYVLSSMWVDIMAFDADNDAEFTLTIRRVNNEGQLTDTLTVSTAKASDIIKTDLGNGEYWYALPFRFYELDEEGFETETNLIIEDAIFVELKGFNSNKVRTFAPMNQAYNHPTYESNCYFYLKGDDDESPKLYDASSRLRDFYSSFLFNMEVTYTWLFAIGDDNKFDAPTAGGEKTFPMNSYLSTKAWWLNEELPEWIEVGASPETVEETTMTVKVKELPANAKGRKFDFTLATFGAEQKFEITQGDPGVGIKEIEASAFSARIIGDDIELSYPEGITAVTMMNIAGHVIATYELSTNGSFTIPATSLSKGIYLLKFSNNETIKVVK